MKMLLTIAGAMLAISASVSAAPVTEKSHPELFVPPPKVNPVDIESLINPKYSREAAIRERYEELRRERERHVVDGLALERYKKAECRKSKKGKWIHPELNIVLSCKSYEEQQRETKELLCRRGHSISCK